MIAIVDYGLGNVQAFINIYKGLGLSCRAAKKADELDGATRLVLPGVGSFDHAMELLERSGMRDPLESLVHEQRVPILGVCVGMQILADSSEEGEKPGLGWISGRVKKFDHETLDHGWPIPHMGWNAVSHVKTDDLFSGMGKEPDFYFLHSYYFDCASEETAIGTTEYGIEFASVIRSGNVFGVQFHPEKSHEHGTTLLRNFGMPD